MKPPVHGPGMRKGVRRFLGHSGRITQDVGGRGCIYGRPLSTGLGPNGLTRAWFERSLSMEREPIMAQKKVLPKDSPFLKMAAEAIGTTLGRLAVKTGVVTPSIRTVTKRKKGAPKKRTVASKTGAVATPATKAAKTSR
jgi:hypothetical protein